EGDLRHQLGTHPVRAREPRRPRRERTVRGGEPVQTRAQRPGHRIGETRADFARIDQRAVLVHADQQGADAGAAAGRIGEAADHESLLVDAFHLEPGATASRAVRRVATLRYDALQTEPARLPEELRTAAGHVVRIAAWLAGGGLDQSPQRLLARF